MAILRVEGNAGIDCTMDAPIDAQRTLEVIERMKMARIGEYNKWKAIIRKIKKQEPLNTGELEYYTRLTRIYKDSQVASRTRAYHTRLSENDEKPPCNVCGEDSSHYCNMNDQYFCMVHLAGHDENEH